MALIECARRSIDYKFCADRRLLVRYSIKCAVRDAILSALEFRFDHVTFEPGDARACMRAV